jgi:hypothetical protein
VICYNVFHCSQKATPALVLECYGGIKLFSLQILQMGMCNNSHQLDRAPRQFLNLLFVDYGCLYIMIMPYALELVACVSTRGKLSNSTKMYMDITNIWWNLNLFGSLGA